MNPYQFKEIRKANILSCYSNADELIKGGEGSRGGKVIGHTSSGKPIYEAGASHEDHKDFNYDEHMEAHGELAKLAGKMGKVNAKVLQDRYNLLAKTHREAAYSKK